MEREISLGIGTTGRCNFNCRFCYSIPLRKYTLGLDEIKGIVEGENKNIKSINFGTGENILNPDFEEIIDYCYDKGIKLSVTSNGYTLHVLDDERLKKFHDVDLSLDFADPIKQNDGRKGDSWNFVHRGFKKCKRLGVEFSIAMALRNENYREIPEMLGIAANEGCNLRLNIFKPVAKSGIYKDKLDYEQFWEAMGLLFEHGELISCSEPIVNAALKYNGLLRGNPLVKESPCGQNSLRIHPNGEVMPCVYWINSNEGVEVNRDSPKIINIETLKGSSPSREPRVVPAEYWTKGDVLIGDLKDSFEPAFGAESFRRIRTVPEYCIKKCDLVEICGGGCAAQRYLNGKLGEPDEYCPRYAEKEWPIIKEVKYHEGEKDLIHSSYLCTLIFAGKK